VVDDPTRAADAARALQVHGWLPANLAGDGRRYVAQAAVATGSIRDVGSAAGLMTAAPDTLVRVSLHFTGVGIAACEAEVGEGQPIGSGCDAGRLATGTGGFFQVAVDGAGTPLLVQTAFPASNVPIHAVGRQVRAERELGGLLVTPWVARLLGWADVLPFAYLDQDPLLPVQRLWIAPLIFVLLALLLFVGRRVGYPILVLDTAGRPMAEPMPLEPGTAPRPVELRVSGRLARERGGPIDVHDAPAELRLSDDPAAGAQLAVGGRAETLEIQLPAAAGALTNLDRGSVHWLRHSQPALWLHWFGSDARLVFTDEATREEAERLLAGLRRPRAGQRPGRRASMPG
jgi:hypothetical protein